MIVADAERIAQFTARGWWGTRTLDEHFREGVARHPGREAVADAPNRAVLTDGGSTTEATPADLVDRATLTTEQARELAALGARVEQHFGRPQDVEWALVGERFALLQARPITALPEPTGDRPTEWPLPRDKAMYFRASIIEQLPDPLTPLFADLVRPAVPAGLKALMAELGPNLGELDIDFVTVYRTVNTFVARRVARQIGTTERGRRYEVFAADACHVDHPHLQCRSCG